jgi:hypothetical protein
MRALHLRNSQMIVEHPDGPDTLETVGLPAGDLDPIRLVIPAAVVHPGGLRALRDACTKRLKILAELEESLVS